MADQLKAETDINEAAAIVRQMDAVLAEDVPYVILFTTPVLEAFRNTLEFPSTTLSTACRTSRRYPERSIWPSRGQKTERWEGPARFFPPLPPNARSRGRTEARG